jgi:iron complex transport system substrate-binding protein
MKSIRNLILKVAVAAILLCFAWQGNAISAMVTDQAGRQLNVPDDPQRVISLAPSITEIVFDLGQEKKLKGVTQFSDYPAAAKSLPRVGSYVRLDLEKIVALKPDLCLAVKDGNPRHIVEKIMVMGIPVYVLNPRNLDQTMDSITRIGSLLKADQRAHQLVKELTGRITHVRSRVSTATRQPRVFFQIDLNPMVSAGNNTLIHELIEMAGGINTTAGEDPYPRYSWEDILRLQPDIVVISAMAGGLNDRQLKEIWQEWDQLAAVKNDQVFVVEAGLFDRATPRLVDGLEILAQIIHPDLFHTGEKK